MKHGVMAASSTSPLVERAKEILALAESLQNGLDNANAECPGLTPGSPIWYPEANQQPQLFVVQQKLAKCSREMLHIAQGPVDTIRAMVGPDRCALAVLQVIVHFKIHKVVPDSGSKSFTDIAKQVDADASSLERVLRMGFLNGIFFEPTAGQVAHNSTSRAIDMLEAWIALLTRVDYQAAYATWPEALSDGSDHSKLRVPHMLARNSDVSAFDYLAEVGYMPQFTAAMKSHTTASVRDDSVLARAFDWTALGEGPVVDLGGGSGHIAVRLARAFPQLKFVVQDQASNEQVALDTIPEDMRDRVTYQTQDFFEPQADTKLKPKAFFLRAIMHDWPDDDCLRILRPLLPYVETGAKIIICDRVLPGPGEETEEIDYYKTFMSMNMFTLFNALERNKVQWKKLFQRLDPRLKMEIRDMLGNESSLVVVSL